MHSPIDLLRYRVTALGPKLSHLFTHKILLLIYKLMVSKLKSEVEIKRCFLYSVNNSRPKS